MRNYQPEREIMEILQRKILSDRRTYAEIAAIAGVSTTSVGRIARGQVNWPRPRTLFGVAAVYGLKLTLTEKNNLPGDFTSARIRAIQGL